MVYFLYGLFFLSCIVLVASVLLQPGKTDAGALFTSNVSSTAFSPRGTATVLSKITIVAAATFMMSALFLAMPAFTGNVSVLQTEGETPAESPASTNSNTAAPDANTAVPDAEANTAVPVDSDVNTSDPGAIDIQPPAANANANSSAPSNTKPAAQPKKSAPAKK